MATNTETTVYIIEMRDKFTMGMNRATRATNRFDRAVSKVQRKIGGTMVSLFKRLGVAAVAGFAAATFALGKFGLEAVKVASKFETVEKALEVMTGRNGLGKDLLNWAKEFSRSTIVTFDQTVTSVRKLLAFGISEQNVKPLTKMLSTIAAGVGQDRLPFLTLALGQVKTRGRLMGTELRQFREHGVDIISELSKGLSVRTPVVEEMVTKGMVSFDMVVAAMQSMVGPNGRFSGMLEEMAKTTEGRFNIMKSTWSIAMAEIGAIMLPAVNSLLDKFIPALEKVSNMDWSPLTAFVDTIGESIKSLLGVRDEEGVFATVLWGVNALVNALDIMATQIKITANAVSSLSEMIAAAKNLDFDLVDDLEKMKKLREQLLRTKNTFREDRRAKAIEALITKFLLSRPSETIETGEFVPSGNTDGIESGGLGPKKTKTNRAVGTGARDIIINIGSLMDIENQSVNGQEGESSEQVMRKLQMALLTVVNDVSLTVR